LYKIKKATRLNNKGVFKMNEYIHVPKKYLELAITPRAKEVLLYMLMLSIEDDNLPSQIEMANMVGISQRQMANCIKELVDAGIIHISKEGRNNYYTIN
jgi:predicted transcriptional regulator